MAEKQVPLEDKVHRDLLKDRAAQEHAARVAIARAMVESGLTRKQAEEIYGLPSGSQGKI